jgi:hypothetical protein
MDIQEVKLRHGLDLAQDRDMCGTSEGGNEPSGFIKCGEILFFTSEEPVSFLRTTLFLGLIVGDVQVLKPSGRSALH